MSNDLVIIRSNSIIYSPRVRKITKSLAKRYSVPVLGWNREGITEEVVQKYPEDLKLLNMRAPFGQARLIAFIPIFWIWVFINLAKVRPKAVHACDFDAVFPCYIYKILFKKKLVFDVCDRYAMAYVPPNLRSLYAAVNLCEEFFVTHSDVVITVAEKFLDTFTRKPKQSAVIMNCSEGENIPAVDKINCTRKRQPEKDLAGVNDRSFTIIYTGNVTRNRGLEKLMAVLKDLPDVKLVIAGKPIDKNLLEALLRLTNVEYKGLLQPIDSLNLTLRSDAMIILYDLQIPNNNFSMSNKLFEAMMCGLPIVTNVSAEVVRDEIDCGVIVDYNDTNQIRNAITCLRDNPLLCQKLGNNGHNAFLQKYNWARMEKILHNIYQDLI